MVTGDDYDDVVVYVHDDDYDAMMTEMRVGQSRQDRRKDDSVSERKLGIQGSRCKSFT